VVQEQIANIVMNRVVVSIIRTLSIFRPALTFYLVSVKRHKKSIKRFKHKHKILNKSKQLGVANNQIKTTLECYGTTCLRVHKKYLSEKISQNI